MNLRTHVVHFCLGLCCLGLVDLPFMGQLQGCRGRLLMSCFSGIQDNCMNPEFKSPYTPPVPRPQAGALTKPSAAAFVYAGAHGVRYMGSALRGLPFWLFQRDF